MTDNFFERNTPPGFKYRFEKSFFGCGLVISFAISVSRFFTYLTELFGLYSYSAQDEKYFLREGAVIDSFYNIFFSSVYGFMILGFSALGFIILHYFYYRENSMSIYLMKRLPKKSERHRLALKLPFLMLLFSFALAFFLIIVYFLLYMLITPDACLPYSGIENLWRR